MAGDFCSKIDRGVEQTVIGILGLILCIALLQVFNRFFLNSSLSWSEEAQVFGHIWIVFLGIPIAYRRSAHLHIDTFYRKMPVRVRVVFNLFVELLWAGFAASLIVLGWIVAQTAHLQESPGLELPMSFPYAGIVVGGTYLLFVAIRRIVGAAWRVVQ